MLRLRLGATSEGRLDGHRRLRGHPRAQGLHHRRRHLALLAYDDEGHLSELASTGSSGDTKYLYDADGSLLIRHSPDATTLYTGDEEITLKAGATSADGVRYISLAGQTVATHSSDGTYTYLVADRLGTGTLAIDSQTQQVTRRPYKPFGETRNQTGTWIGQRGYVGGTQDDNTGLTNLGAREYDPSIGRFLSPDPLLDSGSPQSWNAYDYADDSPVATSDPTGACADIDCPTRNCAYCTNGTPTDSDSMHRAMNDHPGSGSTPNNTKSYAKKHKADISNSTANAQAEQHALERQKATADAAAAAAKKQISGFKHQLLSLVADVLGLTDAYNCFTKGDVMGCVNTALTAVPWGKAFKAIKVGVEAFKVPHPRNPHHNLAPPLLGRHPPPLDRRPQPHPRHKTPHSNRHHSHTHQRPQLPPPRHDIRPHRREPAYVLCAGR